MTQKSEHAGEKELSVHTLNDLLHMEFPENRWLVEGLVPLRTALFNLDLLLAPHL